MGVPRLGECGDAGDGAPGEQGDGSARDGGQGLPGYENRVSQKRVPGKGVSGPGVPGHSRGGRRGAGAAGAARRCLRPPAAGRLRGRAGGSPGSSASAASRLWGRQLVRPRAAPAAPRPPATAAPAPTASRLRSAGCGARGAEPGAMRVPSQERCGTRCGAGSGRPQTPPRGRSPPRPGMDRGHFRAGLVQLWEVAFARFFDYALQAKFRQLSWKDTRGNPPVMGCRKSGAEKLLSSPSLLTLCCRSPFEIGDME